ncbi:hypothetical protein D3C73_1604800 [compost metagenome]
MLLESSNLQYPLSCNPGSRTGRARADNAAREIGEGSDAAAGSDNAMKIILVDPPQRLYATVVLVF